MMGDIFAFFGRWGFLYIDILLAGIFFWLSYTKQRRFYTWFGVAMLFQGLTQWQQELGRDQLAQILLLLFWTTIIVGIIVLVMEVREFAKYLRRRQAELEDEEGRDG